LRSGNRLGNRLGNQAWQLCSLVIAFYGLAYVFYQH
jgi:hypothetical protein